MRNLYSIELKIRLQLRAPKKRCGLVCQTLGQLELLGLLQIVLFLQYLNFIVFIDFQIICVYLEVCKRDEIPCKIQVLTA